MLLILVVQDRQMPVFGSLKMLKFVSKCYSLTLKSVLVTYLYYAHTTAVGVN